jgi:hypothetical protein
MALERIHTCTLSIDGTYINLKDITTLADYVSEGINDPVAQTVAITITATDDTTSTAHTYTATASASDLRDPAGLDILATAFSGGISTFVDDLWEIKIDWTFDVSGTPYNSTTDNFFYSTVKNEVVKDVISADWKDGFNYKSKQTYSKRALQMKSWIDQLELADKNGLLNEGKTILNSLKSIL